MRTSGTLLVEERSTGISTAQADESSVVTGAFGYTGKYIARRLVSQGQRVLTLTGHLNRTNPFGDKVSVAPLNFDRPDQLARRLQGATTLFNTYWVRFPFGQASHDQAIENTLTLIEAAREAGVRRVVHISITSASLDSHLPYFRGKGLVEKLIMNSGLSYAIIRPTLIFGIGDVLINNIAWLLRRFPVFVVPGAGDYRVQPVCVEDLAKLATDAARREDNMVIDAVGPEVYTFDGLVKLVAASVHSKARIVHCRPKTALIFSRLIGRIVDDVVLTEDEVDGLMEGLLVSPEPPSGRTSLSAWLTENGGSIGIVYASELNRHYHRAA
ncbi:MAG: NAD(P)H-binding protein [Dehalococcoidia bacterium]|nr:NAD(P)H-binding protein [Dehalococcoidia bacterium]